MREELLPVVKIAKDRSQPLPYQPPSNTFSGTTITSETPNYEQPAISPPVSSQEKTGSSLSRTFSKKLFAGGSTPKNHSPTHIPQSIPEGKSINDNSTLDPSAAAVAASSHLTASMNGGQPSPKGIPSPTSPSFYSQQQQTLGPRTYTREQPANSNRTTYDHSDDGQSQQPQPRSERTTSAIQSSSGAQQETPTSAKGNTPNSRAESSGPSVEIFKSFRVSMDDPCHKVLPAALKKYNIHEDWRLYALYIVYGDQERCLGLEERPLILFKQLDKEGRKPMFMLRKQAPVIDVQNPVYPMPSGPNTGSIGIVGGGDLGSAGGGNPTGGTVGRSPANQPNAIQLPGGVL